MDFLTATAIRDKIRAENSPGDVAIMLGQLFSDRPDVWEALHNREITPGVVISNPGPEPAQMLERYLAGVSNAGGRWTEGMQSPRRDPKQAALRAKGKWANRVTEAIQNDAYSKGISAYDQAEAIAIAIADGGAAYVAGATKRAAKVGRAFTRLAPLLGGVSQAIQAMPQDTETQREQRLIQARRMMIQVGKTLKGATGG